MQSNKKLLQEPLKRRTGKKEQKRPPGRREVANSKNIQELRKDLRREEKKPRTAESVKSSGGGHLDETYKWASWDRGRI